MDAFELMGKVSRKGGVGVGAERGEGGGDAVVQSACVGVACVPGMGAPGATAEGHRGERAWVKELRA